METTSPPSETVAPGQTTALFSLQVCVDGVSYNHSRRHGVPSSSSSSSLTSPASVEYLLAFQLLQFDIVLFDNGVLSGELQLQPQPQPQPVVAASTLGQSCLFECDPFALALDIRSDASAALVLLVLERNTSSRTNPYSHERARLVAFACVALDLPPHLPWTEERPRVSEWISVDATKWPLVDHENQKVGSITASVTLACLGRALAPHAVAQRFSRGAVQLLQHTNSSSRLRSLDHHTEDDDDSTTGDHNQHNQPNQEQVPESHDQHSSDGGAAVAPPLEVLLPPPSSPVKTIVSASPVSSSSQRATTTSEERRDAAVQCPAAEQDDDAKHDDQFPKPLLFRAGQARSSVVVVDELDRVRIHQGPRGTNRNDRHVDRRSSSPISGQLRRRHDAVRGPVFSQQPELPPPLFFHKPKRQKEKEPKSQR